MAFWLIASLLLVVAAALLVVPTFRRADRVPGTTRDSLNKAFYHERLAELAQDEQQGIIAERPVLVQELQENLLSDIPGRADAPVRPVGRWVLIPGVLVLVLVTVGFYLKTGGLVQVAAWQQAVRDLPALRARVADDRAAPLTMEEVARLGLGLRTALRDDPQNVENWLMLGRVGVALNNAATATQAFGRAYALQPENREVQLAYADVLTRSADPADQRQAETLLKTLGSADPADLRVLNLLAFNAFQQGNYPKAIEGWGLMLKVLPANDPRAEMLRRSIQQARSKAGMDNTQLGVAVTLSPEAARGLPAQGMVLISVTDGSSPVPVAVKRLPLSRFPLALTIDDTNAMMPERLLSSIHQVKVKVRISPDGSATPRSGEWAGESSLQPFSGQKHINVEINQQVP